MLKLVAPATMGADAQMVWLQAAIDALEGIHAAEVNAISAELRRSVTRHNQIVPEIAKLVSEKRQRANRTTSQGQASREWEINQEAQKRRAKAHGREDLNAVWEWERQARIDAGLHVEPRPKPFTQAELDNMPVHIRKMGLNSGFLEYRDGKVVEVSYGA